MQICSDLLFYMFQNSKRVFGELWLFIFFFLQWGKKLFVSCEHINNNSRDIDVKDYKNADVIHKINFTGQKATVSTGGPNSRK